MLEAVVMDYVFNTNDLPLELDAEGIRSPITGPQQEFAGFAVGVQTAVEHVAPIEIGVHLVFAHHLPVVGTG